MVQIKKKDLVIPAAVAELFEAFTLVISASSMTTEAQ